LRQARERLGLRFRDVEEASQVIAQRYGIEEFAIHISRLSAFKNDGTVPNIYKLYSLCAIYRLDFSEVLSWYGVDLAQSGSDAFAAPIPNTHLIQFETPASAEAFLPISLDPAFDSRRTTFLSRVVQRWGTLPLALLQSADTKSYRYAFIGEDDYWMFPMIRPGSLLVVDEQRRRIERGPWDGDALRPLYFIQTREGEYCSWVSVEADMVGLIPHPSSGSMPKFFPFDHIEVIGQVVGLATRLDSLRRSRGRL
jgi:transcriptional regulator with XRE-family HTH domain